MPAPVTPTIPTILTIDAGSASWQDEINTNFTNLLAAMTTTPRAIPQCAIADLPPASSWEDHYLKLTNPAGGKGRLVYSDGTNWLYDRDDSTV
jgi:hypothetical protein